MQEGLSTINTLLLTINNSLDIGADVVQEEGEELVSRIYVKALKDDGALLLGLLYETLNHLVRDISPQHEVIYDTERGLVLARLVTQYVIEEQAP